MTIDPTSYAVRFSLLKRMAQSPQHYLHGLSSVYDASEMRKGRAVHSHLLGGAPTVVYDQGVRRGARWDMFVAAHPGANILIPSESAHVTGMIAAVERHERAVELLEGIREREMTWKIGSRICSGTPDVIRPLSVVELKTAKSSEPGRFVRDAQWRGYHAQLAYYMDGAAAAGIAHPRAAFIVAVESTAPFPVTVLELTPSAIEMGRRLWRSWFERLLVCEQSRHWPAYSDAVVPFDVDAGGGTIVIDGEETDLAELGF